MFLYQVTMDIVYIRMAVINNIGYLNSFFVLFMSHVIFNAKIGVLCNNTDVGIQQNIDGLIYLMCFYSVY